MGSGPQIDKERDSKIVEAYVRGDSLPYIMGAFDISRARIYTILNRNGVTFTRKPWLSKKSSDLS
jgi:hypothetical protein